MSKFAIGAVALLLFAVAGGYSADWTGVSLPVLSTPAETPPAYVSSIGTAAERDLETIDVEGWFAEELEDPYDPGFWRQVAHFVAESGTEGGWGEACALVAETLGEDRTANVELGALGCSDDPSVTRVQRFAMRLLAARSETALWIRGAPGSSTAAIGARLAEARLLCAVEIIEREGGEDSPYARACELARQDGYREGDGASTFEALGEAYGLVAGAIAERDPTVEGEPAYFDDEASAESE